MKRAYERREAEQLFPLLRSIGREIRARRRERDRLQERVAALTPTRHAHAEELGRYEGELATQRRELRHAEQELERLGCRLDGDEAVRILIPSERDAHCVEGFLEQTCFRPAPASLRRAL